VNGFDNSILAPFKERIESNGLSVDDLNLVGLFNGWHLPFPFYSIPFPLNSLKANIYGYIHLYDALKLYSLAARMGLNETGGNPNVTTDGRFLWNKMRRMSFPGMATSRNTQNKSSNNGSSSMESGKKENKFPTPNGNLGGIGKNLDGWGREFPHWKTEGIPFS
jgi:hypothetical protein